MDRVEHHGVVLNEGVLSVWSDEGRTHSNEHRLVSVMVSQQRLDEVTAHVHHLQQ